MAISDIERREVAARLRENAGLSSRLPNEYSIEVKSALVLSKLLDCIDCSDDVFPRLADLIDRPTCRNEEDSYDRTFLCSACGYEAYTYSDSNCNPHDFSYCPECGAEVVE